ncbi:MAG: hypothetical protein GAK43_01434 [Stenotrophomonas maltophilia]|nr:MAG: hypothetical protein GAK43_01434 [Stenotrophomonas maltophilia]
MPLDPQNPYATPTAALDERVDQNQALSIEAALARGYDFNIGDILSEAWNRISGVKGILVVGFIIYMAVVQGLSFLLGAILGFGAVMTSGQGTGMLMVVMQLVIGVLVAGVGYPFLAGINMIGIRRAADQPVSINEMFSHFGLFVPLFLTGLLMTVLVYLGLILLIIPGIYLSIAYSLAIPLAVERKLSPWQALEASRKAVTQRWFKIFGLYFMLGLLFLVASIPLGIGLIWVGPMIVVAVGILYRTIFGVLPAGN